MVPDTEQYLAVPFKSRWPVFQPLSQYIMKSRHALTRINKKAAQIKFKYEECRKLWIECEVKDK